MSNIYICVTVEENINFVHHSGKLNVLIDTHTHTHTHTHTYTHIHTHTHTHTHTYTHTHTHTHTHKRTNKQTHNLSLSLYPLSACHMYYVVLKINTMTNLPAILGGE